MSIPQFFHINHTIGIFSSSISGCIRTQPYLEQTTYLRRHKNNITNVASSLSIDPLYRSVNIVPLDYWIQSLEIVVTATNGDSLGLDNGCISLLRLQAEEKTRLIIDNSLKHATQPNDIQRSRFVSTSGSYLCVVTQRSYICLARWQFFGGQQTMQQLTYSIEFDKQCLISLIFGSQHHYYMGIYYCWYAV